jgi:hypothetical protein
LRVSASGCVGGEAPCRTGILGLHFLNLYPDCRNMERVCSGSNVPQSGLSP